MLLINTGRVLDGFGNNHQDEIITDSNCNNDSIVNNVFKLFKGIDHELTKRDWYSDSSDGGKYAFFAFFAAALIIFIIMICMVNIKRIKRGRAPIISSYLTPPSYHQSQVAYEGQTVTNLPTYTPNPNVNQDVGYYDKNGNFIPTTTTALNNNNDTNPNDSSFDNTNLNNPFNNGIEMENAYTQQVPSSDANIYNDNYSRPGMPNPSQRTYNAEDLAVGSSTSNNSINLNNNDNSNINANTTPKTANDDLPPYIEPEIPSPSHTHPK